MLKRILSALNIFPTLKVCAYCRRWFGIRLGTATIINGKIYNKTHGICPRCARGMWL